MNTQGWYTIEIFEEELVLQPWEILPPPPSCLTPAEVRAHVHSILTENSIVIVKEHERNVVFEAKEEQIQMIKEKLRDLPLFIDKHDN